MPTTPAALPSSRPPLAIVVAMTRSGVIGRDGALPWDLPADRRLFRALTEGNTVIMGRKTFASIGAPLPRRHNLVVTRTGREIAGVSVCRSFRAALALGGQLGRPVFVIGGVELYRQALAIADTLHISWVDGEFPGDRHFPAFDLAEWRAVDSVGHPGFKHVTYRRNR